MSVFARFEMKEQAAVDGSRSLKGKNIVLLGNGSISAMYLPAWVAWFHETYPEANLRVLLTPSARGFLGMSALSAFTQRPVEIDSWQGHETESYHVELERWADAFIIYPATANFLARFANGSCDSPAMLALQASTAPIVIAPALPPGFLDSEAWRMHKDAIGRRRNAWIVDPIVGTSSFDGVTEAYPPQSFMRVTAELINKFDQLSKGESGREGE